MLMSKLEKKFQSLLLELIEKLRNILASSIPTNLIVIIPLQ